MTHSSTITLRYTTDDGICECVKLTDRSLEEARDFAKQLLDIGNGLYQSVDISVDDAVVETLRPGKEPGRHYDVGMDDGDYRCPKCGSDLITIYTDTIADELLECRACLRLYRVEYVSDGTTRLVAV
jgi:hypothetical protein